MKRVAGHAAIDLILLGPNDLAHSMGFNGDTTRPELQGGCAGNQPADPHPRQAFWSACDTEHTAEDWIGRGARFLYTTLEQYLAPSLSALAQVSQHANRKNP